MNDSFNALVDRCWNAGMTLSQASIRLRMKGHVDTQALIERWRHLKSEYGVSCIRPKTEPPTERELNQEVRPGQAYGNWKGLTDPGKRLAEMLKYDRIHVVHVGD